METIQITQHFPIAPAQLFPLITEPQHVKHWWGSQQTLLDDFQLDFRQPGLWSATIVAYKTGKSFTASGQITNVINNEGVTFTWAWHDLTNQRQQESQVSFVLTATDDQPAGTMLTVLHQQLANAFVAQTHRQGWREAIDKLMVYLDQHSINK